MSDDNPDWQRYERNMEELRELRRMRKEIQSVLREFQKRLE